MTLANIVSEMNKTRPRVKTKRIIFLKGYYLSMYRAYMMKLFDDCYISDPTVFDRREINRNIAEMSITDLFGYSGSLNLSYEQIEYAHAKATGVTKDFLQTLMMAVKYRDCCQYIDNFFEEFNFRNYSWNKVRLNICYHGAMVVSKGGTAFNEVTAECLSEFEDEIKTISINEYVWCLAMNELGIPKEEWQDDGLMDAKLSHEDEVKCCEGILNGKFKVVGGKYSDVLINWLKEHPWGTKRQMSVNNQGLFDYIFSTKISEVNCLVESLTSAISEDKDCAVVGMYGSNIYYKQKRLSYNLPLGMFQVLNNSDSEETLNSPWNCVYGITGELYTPDRLDEDEINYVGCPVEVVSPKGTILMYDREQTDIQFDSWYTYNDADFTFGEDEASHMPKSPFRKGTASDELYNGYINSLKSVDRIIVSLPVKTLEQLEQTQKETRKFIEGVLK